MAKYDLTSLSKPQQNPLQLWETAAKLVLANSSNNNVSFCSVSTVGGKPYLSVYFTNNSTEYTYKVPSSICSLLDNEWGILVE